MPFIPTRWCKLRLDISGHFVAMHASTSDKEFTTVHQSWDPVPERMLYELPSPSPLRSTLNSLLQRLTAGLPDCRPGPHSTGPVPIAVFLASSSLSRLQPLLEFLAANLESTFAPDRIEVVRLTKSQPLRRNPIRLPLSVAGVKATASALQGLRSVLWLAGENVRNYGVRVTEVDSLKQAFTEEPLDVLLTDQPGQASTTIRRLPSRRRPRLVIAFGAGIDVERVSRGTAWLQIPTLPDTVASQAFVRDFLYAVLHDLPLHEAVKAAERLSGPKGLPATLFADPLSLEYLRLSDVLAHMHRRVINGRPLCPSWILTPSLNAFGKASRTWRRRCASRLRQQS